MGDFEEMGRHFCEVLLEYSEAKKSDRWVGWTAFNNNILFILKLQYETIYNNNDIANNNYNDFDIDYDNDNGNDNNIDNDNNINNNYNIVRQDGHCSHKNCYQYGSYVKQITE